MPYIWVGARLSSPDGVQPESRPQWSASTSTRRAGHDQHRQRRRRCCPACATPAHRPGVSRRRPCRRVRPINCRWCTGPAGVQLPGQQRPPRAPRRRRLPRAVPATRCRTTSVPDPFAGTSTSAPHQLHVTASGRTVFLPPFFVGRSACRLGRFGVPGRCCWRGWCVAGGDLPLLFDGAVRHRLECAVGYWLGVGEPRGDGGLRS